MKTNLGKVAITPKGTWNSTTVYTALDTVNFGGGSWLAKRGNIAVTPTEGDDWMQLSAKGADAELTKDSIVSALGYEPRENISCELVHTFTVSEDVSALTLTQDADDNAYNFKSCFVKASFFPTTLTGNIGIRFRIGNQWLYGYMLNPRPSVSVNGYAPAYVDNMGFWKTEIYSCASGTGSVYPAQDVLINHGAIKYDGTGVDMIYLFGGIAASTVLEIYAVRS